MTLKLPVRPPATGTTPGTAPPLRDRAVSDLVDDGFAQRVERCRAAARAGSPAGLSACLQLFDLGRMRARVGWRWEALRPRAVGLLQASLEQELAPDDLVVDDGALRLFVVRAAGDRRQIERHGELLAAEVTARLCGTIPGGAIIRVASLPFDPDRALAGAASPAEVLDRVDRAWRQPEPGASDPIAPVPLEARFRPVLHLRKRLVSAYLLVATTRDEVDDPAPEAAWGEALDGWTLQQAAEALRAPRRPGEPALIAPVHYASLASRRPRELLMQACRELPPRSSRQLVFELCQLPPDLPQARARELLGYLHPFCVALLVRLPRLDVGIEHLLGTGARGVSVAVPDANPGEALAPVLTTLAGTARVHGLRSMLVDLAEPRLCRLAAAAGIDHVCGDGLMPPLRRPGRAFRVA
jgi:hypothetical protein